MLLRRNYLLNHIGDKGERFSCPGGPARTRWMGRCLRDTAERTHRQAAWGLFSCVLGSALEKTAKADIGPLV